MNRLETIRLYILIMLCDKGSGHLGGALGMVEVLAPLVDRTGYDPKWFSKYPDGRLEDAVSARIDRSIFVLSNGHTCAGLYATWVEKGLFDELIDAKWQELGLENRQTELLRKFSGIVETNWLQKHSRRLAFLSTFREINSPLDGHPSLSHLPFLVDSSTGPLGQGAGMSVGYAHNQKLNKTPYSTFVCVGDGECQEGQIWEAAMLASKLRLDNLTWVIDRNYIQIDGNTEEVGGLDNSTVFNKHSGLADKFLAFGWEVYENSSGNDSENVQDSLDALRRAQQKSGRPGVLINFSRVGYPFKTFYSYKWHGKTPSFEDVKAALLE